MKLRGTSNLRPPAWPIKRILANVEAYEKAVALRRSKLASGWTLQGVARLHARLTELKQKQQNLATERNSIGKRAQSEAVRQGQRDTIDSSLREQAGEIKEQLATVEKELTTVGESLDLLLDSVPNLVDPRTASVPPGEDFEVLDYFGGAGPDMKPQKDDHIKIGKILGILDLEAGARASGTGHPYLVGAGALLEQALVTFAIARIRAAGFKLISVPTLVRQQFSEACGFRPRDDADVAQMYSVYGGGGTRTEPLALVGTAEISLASQYAHRSIAAGTKHAAVCRSYRAEAGSRGAETRGLYRVHEFTKVEMFMWTAENQSSDMLEWLVEIQRDLFETLQLPCRIIRVAAHDLGAPAYAKYDIEAWMPGRGDWGEISSASNCTDFQARRLHTKIGDDFAHTLNGTAMAVPRIIVALLENGWDPASKSVRLPPVLHEIMGSDCISIES